MTLGRNILAGISLSECFCDIKEMFVLTWDVQRKVFSGVSKHYNSLFF